MKRYAVVLTVFVVVTIIFAVLQIVTAAAFTTDGMELNALDMKRQELVRENTIIKEKIYAASSLTQIMQRASVLGLTENKKSRLVLSEPAPVALNQ